MGGDDELTFGQKAALNWAGFKKFMYNKEAGTVMGRNGKHWGQLCVFYAIFYLCLAGFWAAMLAVFLQTIDPSRPTWNSYISTPAIAYIPNFKGDRVEFELPFKTDEQPGEDITKILNKAWDFLDPANQTEHKDCGDEPGSDTEPQRFCKFDRTVLGPCKPPHFGYDEGKPCVYVNLNKVWGWIPENYAADDEDRPADAVDNHIVVRCLPEDPKYEEYFDVNATKFYPDDGISFGFYPYVIGTDREEQAMFKNPLMAIQFSITRNRKVRIKCEPFFGNSEPLRGIYESDEPTEFTIELFINEKDEQ